MGDEMRIIVLSVLYFLALMLSLGFLFLPGLSTIYNGSFSGASQVILTVLIWYLSSALYFKSVPRQFFVSVRKTSFSKSFKELPSLIGVMAVFVCAFAVISGLISTLVFYVLASGQEEPARRLPVTAAVLLITLLSAPFFIRAFAGFASGDKDFLTLLAGSVRMGGLLYVKYLALGVVSFALSYLIRLLPFSGSGAAGTAVTLILTSIVFGVLVYVSWRIYEKKLQAASEEVETNA